MSKILDITEKLNFEEKPTIKIKNTKIKVNNDAVTILKVVAVFDESNDIEINDLLTLFNLLFDEENQKKIEQLQLSIQDFSTLISETATLVINDNDDVNQGEKKTPATT